MNSNRIICFSVLMLVMLISGCGGGSNSSGGAAESSNKDVAVMSSIIKQGIDYNNSLISNGTPPEVALINTVNWFKNQSGIQAAYVAVDGKNINVEDHTGISTYVVLDRSLKSNNNSGSSLTSAAKIIPLQAVSAGIQSVKALVMDPYKLAISNSSVVNELLSSNGNIQVDYLKGENVTLQTFMTLKDYDIIYYVGHGAINNDGMVAISSGEVFSEEKLEYYENFIKKMGLNPIRPDGRHKYIFRFAPWIGSATLGITSDFISDLSKQLKATIVYVDACHSMESSSMAKAFRDNGAKSYIGWDRTVLGNLFLIDVTAPLANSFLSNLLSCNTVQYAYNNLPFDFNVANLKFFGDGNASLPLCSNTGFQATPVVSQNTFFGIAGTKFSQWGSGFTSNSIAVMHFSKPDGTEYATASQQIDLSGSFSITYTVPANKEPGTYTWWVVDGVTGISSKSVKYSIATSSNTSSTIAQNPVSGPGGTTFNQWGNGFTANSNATLHFRKPDGTEYPTQSRTIDGSGAFSISYKSDTSKLPGTYAWWAVDGPTGKSSNTVSYEIIQAGNPKVAQTPMFGIGGTIFSQWGTGFTPNSAATLHFRKPDGSEFPTQSQFIDANGAFSIGYKSETSKTAGIYAWWAVDGTTGKSSNTISYTVSQAVNPTIAQNPMSGASGTTFAQWGTGFTPNSTATLHFKKPDGTEYPTSAQTIDGNGTFSISYVSPTNKPAGAYTWWAVDGPTGKISNVVSYAMTVSPVVAQNPMSGAPGTTFAQWGTGFTPNSTATLHFKKPNGTEYPTSAQSIDGNGTFSISYASPTNKPAGAYTWWAVDGPTKKVSNAVSYKIN